MENSFIHRLKTFHGIHFIATITPKDDSCSKEEYVHEIFNSNWKNRNKDHRKKNKTIIHEVPGSEICLV